MAALPADHCRDDRARICDFNAGNRALFDGGYEGTPCADRDPNASALLRAGSVVSQDATLNYPTTPVHFILGREDCTSALPHAMLFHDAIESEKTITWVDAPHAMQRDPEGITAIIDTLSAGCRTDR
jgi:pimeloyl-ACP methyl ester carboxylesterase